ncbi:MAG TPA: choice-of-anchor B family protein [Longimicrobiales bacterium]|nr:choice-of-anchor B family protein [Longimicrobiales bacterium]
MPTRPILLLAALAAGCTDAMPPVGPAPDPATCSQSGAGAYGCDGIELLALLSVPALGGGPGAAVNDVWGWTDRETGREYALVGRTDATVFVDITAPATPRVVGELPLTDGARPSSWRDMKVHADHVFVVSDGAGAHGMQVFDLRRLRGEEGAPVTFGADALYEGIASAHNLAIDTVAGMAVAVGANGGGETCGGGLHMVDITAPLAPAFAGCFNDPATGWGSGYTHDAQCVTYQGPDTRFTGRRICFGANVDVLSIADVTDPANPIALAAAGYPAAGYLHQGWLTDDRRYFFMDDEADEFRGIGNTRTLVWDVARLDDPILVKEHSGTTRSTDHNLYIRRDRLYQANYTSGLRVLDISDPRNPVEVGWFDTVPGADGPGFQGAWSVYPFFESGTLIVTSIDEGLFILRPEPGSGI